MEGVVRYSEDRGTQDSNCCLVHLVAALLVPMVSRKNLILVALGEVLVRGKPETLYEMRLVAWGLVLVLEPKA